MPAQTTMRALVFTGPATDASTTQVVEQPIPDPGPGELSIDVGHAGINFKDVMMRRGDAAYVGQWPVVPGLEVSGTVRALGDGVEEFAVGDRVAAFSDNGGLAEVAVVPAAPTATIPDGLDGALAAAAPGALITSWLLLETGGSLRPGDTVLVHSAGGGVGQGIAQLAKARGAGLVLGTVGDASRVAGALAAGYDDVFVRRHDLTERVEARAGKRGVDAILDPQGTEQIATDLALVAPGGRIVIFGNASGGAVDPLPGVGQLMGGNVTVAGFSITALNQQAPRRVRDALTQVLALLDSGELQVDLEVVDGLAAAASAQDALAGGSTRGKYVVQVSAG